MKCSLLAFWVQCHRNASKDGSGITQSKCWDEHSKSAGVELSEDSWGQHSKMYRATRSAQRPRARQRALDVRSATNDKIAKLR
eukprot:5592337-Amphidinium_carterae.4